LSGLLAALPADHDDHHGGTSGCIAPRGGRGGRRRDPTSIGHRHRGRSARKPAADALHDPRRLPVPGSLPALGQRAARQTPTHPRPGDGLTGASMNRFLHALFALLLAGCMVGPDYKKQKVEVPEAYKENAEWKVAQPQDQLPRGKWWEIFGDPQLNALAEQVNVSNQSVQVALAQYRQARALIQEARSALFPTVSLAP